MQPKKHATRREAAQGIVDTPRRINILTMRDLGSPRHVSADGGLADHETELEQFAVDAGRTSERIGDAHLADQVTRLHRRLGASRLASPRSPAPIEPEAFAMPLDHSARLDQHHGVQGLWPKPVKAHPEKTVGAEELRTTRVLTPQNRYLVSKGDELQFQ